MQTERIPFTGVYNTRPGTGVLTGTLAIAGIAVAGLAVAGKGNDGSTKDHRLLNCLQITVTDQNARSRRLYITIRPGFPANSTPRTGHIGNAIKVWTGQGTGTKIMSCFGNTNFKLFDATTDKGDGTGKATGITETKISDTATLFITSTDNKGWTYQDGGSLTNINDADFPGNAGRTITGTFAHLGGYPFIMDTGARIYNGDLNSASAWTSASYVTANAVPDVGVGCIRLLDRIIGFCKMHFEVFVNAGNPSGSPLSQESSYSYGLANADAISVLKDTAFFVGADNSGTLGLYAFQVGREPIKLTTPEIDAALAIAGPANISTTIVGFYGRRFVVVCASSSTFLYCIGEGTEHEWTGNQLWWKSDSVVSGSSIVNYTISNDVTTGKVYILNPANVVYADDGVDISGTIQTAKLDFATAKRKFYHAIRLIGDQTSAAANVRLYWSDNDYQTTSSARTLDVSQKRAQATRCGSSYRRSFLIALPASAWRAEALEIDFDVGSV